MVSNLYVGFCYRGYLCSGILEAPVISAWRSSKWHPLQRSPSLLYISWSIRPYLHSHNIPWRWIFSYHLFAQSSQHTWQCWYDWAYSNSWSHWLFEHALFLKGASSLFLSSKMSFRGFISHLKGSWFCRHCRTIPFLFLQLLDISPFFEFNIYYLGVLISFLKKVD